ncbi:MAG: hypothetical protein KF729_38245 [Sandaracinaceae bacterium]|nr:hypothetical protein [Sandaracinaceae bacterium]
MHEDDDEIRRLLGDGASRGVVESMPELLTAARGFAARAWDAQARPPDDPLEKRFGPVHFVISRRWVPQPPDPRRLAWRVEDRALLWFEAMAGARSTPSLEAYLAQRGAVTQDGYYRFGLAPLSHHSGLDACELGEIAPQLAERPMRYVRLLRARRTILALTVEASGGVSSNVGVPFAAVFHSLWVD